MPKTALLIIDVQPRFIDHDPAATAILPVIQRLIAAARAADAPVVYVQDVEHPARNGPIHPAIAPQLGDPVIPKTTSDAFQNTDLAVTLKDLGVTHLAVAGVHTDRCVDATLRSARAQGFTLTLADGAHSPFPDPTRQRENILAVCLTAIAPIAAITPADQIDFSVTP